jgi:aminopeptidase N
VKLDAASTLSITSVTRNGVDFPFTRDESSILFTLPDSSSPIRFEYKANFGTNAGFYRSAEDSYLTQFQLESARTVFPCVDSPYARSIFHLTLRCPSSFRALSNTPPESVTTDGDFSTYVFEPTPMIPTYIVAWALGNFVSVTGKTSRGIDVGIHLPVTSELLPFQDEWKANEIAILDYFEKWRDFELPLKKPDVFIASQFLFGGMENWELLIMNERTLAGRTPGMRRDLLLREMFHQWHSDLVRPRKWAHLSLNEGFACFFAEVFRKIDL